MTSEFNDLGFEKYFYAKGMRSIAGQFTQNNRCGIYILHFENSEYYVGLATDVVKRYAQHRLNHKDIVHVSFKEVVKSKLIEIEKETVYALENLKKALRNINIVSTIIGETDFDLVVSVEDQMKWTNYELPMDTVKTKRFEYSELRNKYTKKFEQLKSFEYFDEICTILNAYAIETIPYPRKAEYSFWSVSCLPSTGAGALYRLNIYWQETLICYREDFEKENGIKESDYSICVYLSKSIFELNFNKFEFSKQFETIHFPEGILESGGQDQMRIAVAGYEFFKLFGIIEIKNAIKDFNLRLLRKGGCIWNRYHCFDLADKALDTNMYED